MAKKKHRYAGPTIRNYTVRERVDSIQRNGITINDLKDNYERGFKQGQKEGLAWGYDSAYGSVLLALHREFGFGHERIIRLAHATARMQIECITTQDAFRALVDETGVSLVQFEETIGEGGLD